MTNNTQLITRDPRRVAVRAHRHDTETDRITVAQLGFDVAATTVAWVLAAAVTGHPDARSAVLGAVGVVATVLLLRRRGLYTPSISGLRAAEIAGIIGSTATAAGMAALVDGLRNDDVRIAQISVASTVAYALLLVVRSSFDAWIRARRANGDLCSPAVIVGAGAEAEDLAVLLNDHPEYGHRLLGVIGPVPDGELTGLSWLGTYDRCLHAVRSFGAQRAFIAVGGVEPDVRRRLVSELSDAGVHVHLSAGLSTFESRRVQRVPIAHEPLLYLQPRGLSPTKRAAKRVIDVVGAIGLLVLATPVVIVAALAIKLDDRGPLLFRQERVGRLGQPFTVFKLRTMRVDAEAERAGLASHNQRDTGPLFKVANDPRVTRAGRILRATSVDELPQLLNVIRGEMSLVGPRPALPDEALEFDDELQQRHLVKPGITGLWQVDARDNPSFRSYRRLDILYVRNWTLSLDFVILVLTAQTVAARILSVLFSRLRGRPDAGLASG